MILYDVVNSTDFSGFLAEVRIKLKEGWKLQGGVSSTWIGECHCSEYVQAITKEIISGPGVRDYE